MNTEFPLMCNALNFVDKALAPGTGQGSSQNHEDINPNIRGIPFVMESKVKPDCFKDARSQFLGE